MWSNCSASYKNIPKLTKIKKIIASITIAAFLFTTVTPAVVHAEMWGTNIAAGVMKQVLEQVF